MTDYKGLVDYYNTCSKDELIEKLTLKNAQLLNMEKELDRLSEENDNLITMMGRTGAPTKEDLK